MLMDRDIDLEEVGSPDMFADIDDETPLSSDEDCQNSK